MAHPSNKWSQPDNPPPPLFTGQKEKDLVKQVNDELIERVIGQVVLYYPISMEHTNFHPIYGEAINKQFLPPVRVYALVEGPESDQITAQYGMDKKGNIKVHFHKRRLTADQDLFVREGDFIYYGSTYYEIVKLGEPTKLFGDVDSRMEILAECIKARKGLFNGE